MTDDATTRSGILKAEFGPSWRVWSWFRRQFTPTSLSAIGFILLSCAGYIIHLRETVATLDTRVVIMETKVVPVLEQRGDVAVLQAEVDLDDERIAILEGDWNLAHTEAGSAPVSHRRR